MLDLANKDWAEIFYALETKLHSLRHGRFGVEIEPGQDAKWIAHLSKLMRKIGPDGIVAAHDGVSARKSNGRRSAPPSSRGKD